MPKKIVTNLDIEFKEKFIERYKALLDNDDAKFEQFKEYSLSYLRKSIRINTLKADPAEIKKRMEKNWILTPIPWYKNGFWIDHEEGRRDIGNTIEHVLGYIYVQEAASMIPPVVLGAQPGEIILDMCASPGSKSTQIAQDMQNKGMLVCNDMTTKRIAPLSINLQRCSVTNSVVSVMNGFRFGGIGVKFDRILLDAPCSGTGTIRKSLKTIQMWNPGMIKRLSKTQKGLIESAFTALKPGGTMVYSTCTLEPEENEGVITHLLNKFEDASIEKIELDIKRSKPIMSFGGVEFNPRVKDCLRIWPQDNDSEGFFVSKIRKI